MIFARKINKTTKFYTIFSRKIYFQIFLLGGTNAPFSLTYAYGNKGKYTDGCAILT